MSLNCPGGQGFGGECVDSVGYVDSVAVKIENGKHAYQPTLSQIIGIQPPILYLHQPLVPINSQKSQTP